MVHFASTRRLRELARVVLMGLGWPLLAIVFAGCHSATGPNPATTGTLIVTINQPAGTSTFAAVGGPAEYATFVSGVDTLLGLTAGTYTLTDPTAVLSAPIVTPFYAGSVTGSPITITIADTGYMSASFTVLPGTGQLWVGSSSGSATTLSGYTAPQLTGGGPPGVSLPVLGSYGVFDVSSNLWIADSSSNTISEYVAAALATAGPPTASVSITSNGLNGPVGLAFDRLGNLWVSNPTANTIVMFSADQLAGGGRATQHHGTHVAPGGFLSPIVTLSGSGLNGPGRFSFDAYGNMWVPNAGSSTVVAFTPAQLRVTGAPTPTVVLASSNASIQGPTAVAFDQQGDLWVANTAGNSIVAFGNAAQTASGAPSPVLTFVVPSSYSGPSAMAFDNSGDLWTISSASSSIIEYTAEQITAFGASAPAYTIQVPSNPVSLAFDPPPNGVPVVGPQTHRLPTIRRPLLTRASR